MVNKGPVFSALKCKDNTPVRNTGYVVEQDDATAVVALDKSRATGVAGGVVAAEIGFIGVPRSALVAKLPSAWSQDQLAAIPDLKVAARAWVALDDKDQELTNSEAEPKPLKDAGKFSQRRTRCNQRCVKLANSAATSKTRPIALGLEA